METPEGRASGKDRKRPIAPARDLLQSRVLVAVLAPTLVILNLQTGLRAVRLPPPLPPFPAEAFGVSLLFALLAWRLRSTTAAGATCGGMACLLLTYTTGWISEPVWRTALTPLLVLFLLTFASTRLGHRRKKAQGLAEPKRGRTASQVLANLGAAALAASSAGEALFTRWVAPCCGVLAIADLRVPLLIKVGCLGALVEAVTDTVSSEIGQAYGGTPRTLLGLRAVPPGTDGAMTLLGTGAGLLGGVAVAAAGAWSMRLDSRAAFAALLAGAVGMIVDTLLGGTAERRGWLGNDLVNFSSTVFAAMLAAALALRL